MGVSAHAPGRPLLLQPASSGLIQHVTGAGRWFAALQTKQALQAERSGAERSGTEQTGADLTRHWWPFLPHGCWPGQTTQAQDLA